MPEVGACTGTVNPVSDWVKACPFKTCSPTET
ncbi:hypothetical protein D046_8954, partial [Vibrio parahaemolyticus V-223/04]